MKAENQDPRHISLEQIRELMQTDSTACHKLYISCLLKLKKLVFRSVKSQNKICGQRLTGKHCCRWRLRCRLFVVHRSRTQHNAALAGCRWSWTFQVVLHRTWSQQPWNQLPRQYNKLPNDYLMVQFNRKNNHTTMEMHIKMIVVWSVMKHGSVT